VALAPDIEVASERHVFLFKIQELGRFGHISLGTTVASATPWLRTATQIVKSLIRLDRVLLRSQPTPQLARKM
jgi:hypothetical protein